MDKKTIGEMKQEIPLWHKINLTFDEAAALSNIGREKLREMARLGNCDFFLEVGPGKTVVNREKFENYLKNHYSI